MLRKPVFINKDLGEAQEGLWLTSYADLITAILAVLVLFMSFSKIDVEKFDSVQRLLDQTNNCKSLAEIKAEVMAVAKKDNVDQYLHLDIDKEGLEINYDSAALFKSGSPVLDLQSLMPFKEVMQIIAEVSDSRKIDISGHTDDVPMSVGSNWGLSSNRALSMMNYLERTYGLESDGIRLSAYGSTKPKMEVDGLKNEQLAYARSMNRRVSITISNLKADAVCKQQ